MLPDGVTRAGFFVGDGAGMGKGREIAGLLAENVLQGRTKALWVSISSDLKVDAERDLSDCGIGEDVAQVVALNKCASGMLTQGGQGGRPAPLTSRLYRIPTHFLLNLHGI